MNNISLYQAGSDCDNGGEEYDCDQIDLTNSTNLENQLRLDIQNGIITKTGGSNWHGGANSIIGYTGDSFIEWEAVTTNQRYAVGFSTRNTNHAWQSLSYALYVQLNGDLHWMNNGTYTGAKIGDYQVGDKLRLERIGSNILIKRNGSEIHRFENVGNEELVMDLAMFEINGKIKDLKMGEFCSDNGGGGTYVGGGNQIEVPIYGSGRIGVLYTQNNQTVYELTDHLGNVRTTFTKGANGEAISSSRQDYYPGGWALPNRQVVGSKNNRYGYQGEFSEKDDETGWNAFELRMYDSRIGRWMTPDPAKQFHSPYLAMGNNWANLYDRRGDSIDYTINTLGEIERLAGSNGTDYDRLYYQTEEGRDIEFLKLTQGIINESTRQFEFGDDIDLATSFFLFVANRIDIEWGFSGLGTGFVNRYYVVRGESHSTRMKEYIAGDPEFNLIFTVHNHPSGSTAPSGYHQYAGYTQDGSSDYIAAKAVPYAKHYMYTTTGDLIQYTGTSTTSAYLIGKKTYNHFSFDYNGNKISLHNGHPTVK